MSALGAHHKGDNSEREMTAGGQTMARGWDSEEGSQCRVIVASAGDCPGSSGLGLKLHPPFSSLTLSHTSSINISCFPPLSCSQRPPLLPYDLLSPQNSATPALKLGSAVLTAHDSWDTPPIIQFSAFLCLMSSPTVSVVAKHLAFGPQDCYFAWVETS